MSRNVPVDPHERLSRLANFERGFAGRKQHALYLKATGHVAKEEPCHEANQQQSDDSDQETFTRR